MSYTYEIPRGDSDNINVIMSDTDGVNIPFETGDTVYLTVKVDTNTETKILQKVVTTFVDNKCVIPIIPADTASLDYGVYVYDIQWTQADGTVTTIVPASQFIVCEAVTNE